MDVSLAHAFGDAALAAAAASLCALAVMHVLPSSLSPLHNAVSQYGISRLRVGYRIATITLGLAGIFDAIGITNGLSGSKGAVVGALAVFGIARLVISWYPMDEPGAARTSHGQAHGLIAVVTFGAITVAALRLGSMLSRTGQWDAELRAIQASGWALLAVILAMVLTRSSPVARRYFGAVERLFYAGMFAFIGLTGAALVWSVH